MADSNKSGTMEDFYRRRDNIIRNQERLLKKVYEDIVKNGGSPVVEKDGYSYVINGNERTFDELFPISEEEKNAMKAKNQLVP